MLFDTASIERIKLYLNLTGERAIVINGITKEEILLAKEMRLLDMISLLVFSKVRSMGQPASYVRELLQQKAWEYIKSVNEMQEGHFAHSEDGPIDCFLMEEVIMALFDKRVPVTNIIEAPQPYRMFRCKHMETYVLEELVQECGIAKKIDPEVVRKQLEEKVEHLMAGSRQVLSTGNGN
jgi:hypothetical protein